jgi:hypothetical protein
MRHLKHLVCCRHYVAKWEAKKQLKHRPVRSASTGRLKRATLSLCHRDFLDSTICQPSSLGRGGAAVCEAVGTWLRGAGGSNRLVTTILATVGAFAGEQ